MTWLLRGVFLLMVAAGVLLGIGLPKAVERLPGYEIGRFQLFAADKGFLPAEIVLAPPEAPFFFTLSVHMSAPLRAGDDRAAFRLTARDENGARVLDQIFGFPNDPVRESPESGYVYREMAVVDRPLDGRHAIELEVTPRLDPAVADIELSVNAGALDLDPRLQPAGFILLVVGGIGLMLSFRRPADSPPPTRKWGRSGA